MNLKELAGYLPYGLKAVKGVTRIQITAVSLELPHVYHTLYLGSRERVVSNINEVKPILRPMSDLTNHECYILLSEKLRMCVEVLSFPNVNDLKVNDYNILLKNHFDIHDLIEKGEAIDVNKIL